MFTAKFSTSILLAALPILAQAGQTVGARELAAEMVQKLGVALKQEIATNGPDGAVAACRDMAPLIAGELSRKSGARVARVSLKPRNPLLGDPDAWEQRVLTEFDRRAAAGEALESIDFSETIDEPQGRYFRYMKALPVQPVCLTCHGSAENIPAQVKARLASEYPHDRATGYALGQIRGAITIKQPLDASN
ncbi:MAG: DUF3365 domain-containing protein [Betaproteobacteria bacterium]